MAVVTIRLARDDDRPWVASLMAASEPWVTLGRDFDACFAACTLPGDSLEMAEREGVRCGFVLVRPRGVAGAPYIVSIAVDAGHRDGGVGAALLRHVEDSCRDRSRHLFLCVSSFNPRARRFYERHGFAAVGTFRDYIIPGADEILMHKALLPSAHADGLR
jgi:ribosomal-protein-alanine N-acetyltransferase